MFCWFSRFVVFIFFLGDSLFLFGFLGFLVCISFLTFFSRGLLFGFCYGFVVFIFFYVCVCFFCQGFSMGFQFIVCFCCGISSGLG